MAGLRRLRPPPDIKVLEAAGALGDGRVHAEKLGMGLVKALVSSSGGERRYLVVVKVPGDKRPTTIYAYSDDNGTRYRGYVGYPIIAVLMIEGLLPRDRRLEEALAGLKWRELNERYKRYSLTKEHALKAASRLIPYREAVEYVASAMARLRSYTIYYDPSLASKHQ
ncbi:MAG: hypothetical protein F7B18_06970 [Desulfurococcales archaeon]|nr:hypothetical protein [Desulfurococcales archaeon]